MSTQKFGLLIDAKVKGANNIKRLGNSMQGAQGKVKNLTMAVRGLSGAFKALAAGVVVAGFGVMVKRTIDQADAFGKLSTRTGIAADKLQAYVNAGKLADVSQEQLTSGLRVFARTQIEASEGVATYADAYKKLGVAVKNQDGSLKASDQLLGEIADRFADLPDGPEKAAVAMDIFGRSGAQMITLLNGGKTSLEEFNYELSENFARNAEFFNDQLTKLGFKFEGFKMQLMDALLPVLIQVTEVFSELFQSESDWNALFTTINVGVRGTSIVMLSLVKLADEAVRYFGALGGVVKALFSGDFGGAFKISEEFKGGFLERLAKSREQFERLAYGRKEAPEGFRGNRPFDAATAGATGAVAASRASGGGDGAGGQLQRLQTEQELTRQLQQQLQDSQRLFAIETQSDALKRLGLEFDREREQLYADHAESMRGQVSTERSLVAAEKLQVDLQRLDNREKQETNKLLEETEQKTTKIGELFASMKDTIASGIGNAIEGLIDGTKTLGESLSGILKSLSRMLLQFGTKSLIGGLFANGAAFQNGRVTPYAYGGIVNRPTLFPMANGMGLMGEAGPEAVMPLRRGRNGRLGVEAGGGVGNVVVNVDAAGTSAQGDSSRARQLGDALGVAVRQELLRQKRPGGLLA